MFGAIYRENSDPILIPGPSDRHHWSLLANGLAGRHTRDRQHNQRGGEVKTEVRQILARFTQSKAVTIGMSGI